jgi:hypothetical protein
VDDRARTLAYLASFRPHWNSDLEVDLLKRFQLDASKTAAPLENPAPQLALIGALSRAGTAAP